MSESDKTPKATCGSVIVMGVLAGLVVYAQRAWFHADAPPNWGATAAAAVAVVAAFVAQRRFQNIFAGLAAAALLTVHPTWWRQTEGNDLNLLAEAVVPAVGACVAVGWRLAFHPCFAWRMWPVVAVALAGCEGLALASSGRQGFYALVLAPTGLLAGAALAVALRGRALKADRPSPFNPPTALVVAVAATVGGVLLGHFLAQAQKESEKIAAFQKPELTVPKVEDAWGLIVRRLDGSYTFSTDAFMGSRADAWAWPHLYVTLPVLAYAFWRTIRRGAIQWRRKQPPTAWLLSLAAVAVPALLAVRPSASEEQTPLVPLVSLVVALVVFLLVDLMQGAAERLVLRPPEEEEAAATERTADLGARPALVGAGEIVPAGSFQAAR